MHSIAFMVSSALCKNLHLLAMQIPMSLIDHTANESLLSAPCALLSVLCCLLFAVCRLLSAICCFNIMYPTRWFMLYTRLGSCTSILFWFPIHPDLLNPKLFGSPSLSSMLGLEYGSDSDDQEETPSLAATTVVTETAGEVRTLHRQS
jgi:hypothetical protein